MDAKSFYGAAYGRARDVAKLDEAVKTFNMAMNAHTPGIADRALKLAADKELAAFG